jgi:hypothetical protein
MRLPWGCGMLRTWRSALPVLVLVSWAPTASAYPVPPFCLDDCSRNATHVVVVTEGACIDGHIEVLESWRGNLRRGDRLHLPGLAVFADRDLRTIAEPEPGEPIHVTGSRMVVFLRWRPERTDPTKGAWAAARFTGMGGSVAWVERGEAYTCPPLFDPTRPYELARLGMTEKAMRQRVRHFSRVWENLDRAVALPDPARRAAALCTFVRSDAEAVREAALRSLGQCGEPALPAFRKLLEEHSLSRHHGEVVRTLAQLGGTEAGRELAAIMERELTFWKAEGPKLPVGWWNGAGLEWSKVGRLRDRYIVAREAIEGLGKGRGDEGRKAVTAFRDFWRSLPQLEDSKYGLAELSEECDRVLAGSNK